MRGLPSPLLVVTDRHQARRPLEDIIHDAVKSGARWVWLRDRDMERVERRRLALRLMEIVGRAGGVLSIGDDTELAAEIGAHAAHLRDVASVARARAMLGADSLIGLSAHRPAQAAEARAAGADYITLSPVFETASKPGYGPALGLDAIGSAAKSGIPVVALGGIDALNAPAVFNAGAAGIAVLGGVMRASTTQDAVRALFDALRARTSLGPDHHIGGLCIRRHNCC